MTGLWNRDNLHAWCVQPWDDAGRDSEERIAMIADLGFTGYAAIFMEDDLTTTRRELEAIARHGIELVAWWWRDWKPTDDFVTGTLALFREFDVRPRLWVMQDIEGWNVMPATDAELEASIEAEARRFQQIAEVAATAGCEVDLYNHNGWFGIMENEVRVLERATELGARGLGISYNFSHARDELHDDTQDFAAVWRRIQPHVSAVNLAGTHHEDGTCLRLGDGDSEFEMMRVIQDSGWRGAVGLIAESGGDARETLGYCLATIDEYAARLSD